MDELTEEERKNAIGSLIFLKEKEDGEIQGSVCADGRKQRDSIRKDEATSPTVALESVILTAIIEAHENRDVAVLDIPNAFIQTDMEGEKVIMKLCGELAELLVTTAPELYHPFLHDENGKAVLYVELLKALYGTLKAALLFYKKLVKDLISYGFELNVYDPCVANKMINGKQMTVIWHVDDLKISHQDSNEVTKFIQWIKSKYEDANIGKVHTSHGKKHKYLGINFDFSKKGSIKIEMKKYIEDMIKTFPEKLISTATTPAAHHLFNVHDNVAKLDNKKATIFHTITAKGLFFV